MVPRPETIDGKLNNGRRVSPCHTVNAVDRIIVLIVAVRHEFGSMSTSETSTGIAVCLAFSHCDSSAWAFLGQQLQLHFSSSPEMTYIGYVGSIHVAGISEC